jgi:hypothetical protein
MYCAVPYFPWLSERKRGGEEAPVINNKAGKNQRGTVLIHYSSLATISNYRISRTPKYVKQNAKHLRNWHRPAYTIVFALRITRTRKYPIQAAGEIRLHLKSVLSIAINFPIIRAVPLCQDHPYIKKKRITCRTSENATKVFTREGAQEEAQLYPSIFSSESRISINKWSQNFLTTGGRNSPLGAGI